MAKANPGQGLNSQLHDVSWANAQFRNSPHYPLCLLNRWTVCFLKGKSVIMLLKRLTFSKNIGYETNQWRSHGNSTFMFWGPSKSLVQRFTSKRDLNKIRFFDNRFAKSNSFTGNIDSIPDLKLRRLYFKFRITQILLFLPRTET